MIVLLFCKTLCHYKSLTPSESMPQKNNRDFKGKYPDVRVGTLVSMRNNLDQKQQSHRIQKRHIRT